MQILEIRLAKVTYREACRKLTMQEDEEEGGLDSNI